MIPLSGVSAPRILLQYGAVSAPFFSGYRGLLNPGAASAPSSAPALVTPHPVDRFLAASPEDVLNATHQMQPHQVVAALNDHQLLLRHLSGSTRVERLHLELFSEIADLVFRDHGLKIQIGVGPDAVTTRGYVIETDTAGLRDFIQASLGHYNNVPDRFFDGTPDFATATTDDIMLAASLIYHQQFLMDGAKGPFDFMDVARAHTVSDQLKTGQNQEHAWVPSQKGDREHPVEIDRFADGRVQITIRNTKDHGKPNMPLFGNVLVMGARELSNGFRAMPFLDLLG